MNTSTILHFYEVYVADRRIADTGALGLYSEFVRAPSEQAAKLVTILRNNYAESDLPYLDFAVHERIFNVQQIDEDA